MRSSALRKIFILYTLFSSVILNGQETSFKEDTLPLIYSRNHYSFFLLSGMNDKATITRSAEPFRVGSRIQQFYEAGFEWQQSLDTRMSLIYGLHLSLLIRNFEYRIPGQFFQPPFDSDIEDSKKLSKRGHLNFRLPVLFSYRYWCKKQAHKYWAPQAGLSLGYAFLTEDETTHTVILNNGQALQYMHILLQPNNNGKPFINYHAGLEHGMILRNRNILSFRLLAGLSSTRFIKGNYSFNIPGQTTMEGSYSLKGSFLGIGSNYTFTGSRKIRR